MTPDLEDGPVAVYQGDALPMLRELPAESVHCVVTSPPYWGLRDYGTVGQLGLEPTLEEYVANMVALFREVRRVLRRDGTCWLNLGDSYAANVASAKPPAATNGRGGLKGAPDAWTGRNATPVKHPFKTKDLVGIPWMVAFALRADGWYLRSDIIWSKPNPMPESVTDRPTKAHEYVFLLTRSDRYYYDAEAVREPSISDHPSGNGYARPEQIRRGERGQSKGWTLEDGAAGRNKRSVWTIATQPYPEAHFATYPEDLVIPCIKAGTSERGCCPECGAPWRRVVSRTASTPRQIGSAWHEGRESTSHHGPSRPGHFVDMQSSTTGWEPTCKHNDRYWGADRTKCAKPPIPCTILDPFAGSGTTLAVARRLGRRSVGIELNPTYLPLIWDRITRASLPLIELIQH